MDEQFPTLEIIRSEESVYNPVCDMLEPPNPIISKTIENIDERASFKIDASVHLQEHMDSKHSHHSHHSNHEQEHHRSSKDSEQAKKKEVVKYRPYMEFMTLTNGYEKNSLIFKRYFNDSVNRRGKMRFFSSLFVGIEGNRGLKLPQYKGMISDDDLIFDSNFESANLMAVFKVLPTICKIEDRVYDLVLQNDLNTKGFTQWYNFKVHNKRNNFIAKFNIVNLYKSKSLYNIGMKPIVRSEKSDKNVKRTWRRKGYNIYYQKNDLSYEDNNSKCYKTLTFQYDFTVENDVVQFAHGMPYDLTDLQFLLNSIKGNPKVKMTNIGTTVMGKPIPMIKISGDQTNKMEKKALVILGRQHPGETPGSYIAQQMILELLRNSSEVDFLHWRFDIFIIPMVNMDGVYLGNYRSNFAGFDLNRCWLHPDPVKHPEVIAIKNQIKKIQRRYKIELILDLHGHSRKMGSFFYGNNYGTNFMLFPFIASKANKNILFEQSRFSHETELDVKGSTARVVLGNLLKDTGGYVYTYEVSFYGNYKEDHTPFSFQEEHYKELGKALVVSIYRTYLEIYKEEKSLKESHFLKGVKTEIHDLAAKRHIQDEVDSGSDSEAAEEMKHEEEQIDQFFEDLKNADQFSPPPILMVKRPSAYEGIDRQISISKIRDLRQLGQPVEKYDQQMKQKIYNLLDKNNDDLKDVIMQRLPSIRKDEKILALKKEISSKNSLKMGQIEFDKDIESVQISKKKRTALDYYRIKKFQNYADWLKIHGQTFVLQERQKQRHGHTERLTHPNHSKDERTIQHIKHNLILINNISKSVDKNSPLQKHVNTVNLMDNMFQKVQEDKETDYHQKKLNTVKNRANHSRLSKEFPVSIAYQEANAGSTRVNRLDFQKQQNKTRMMNSTPSKEIKAGKAKLPPI